MSETDAKGYAYTYNYDDKHNMTQATSQRGITYNYTYNSAGNPTTYIGYTLDWSNGRELTSLIERIIKNK